MSGTARVWTPPPSRWARLRAGAGTLVLLSFVTSTSLNYARLTRERREERRLHAIQCRVLRQLHEQLATSSFHARASTSRVTLDEQRLLAARLRAVQLDPRAVGISKRGTRLRGGRGGILDDDDGNANDDDDEDESRIQQIRTAQTSWKTILFGGDGTGSRIKQAIGATVQAVRRGEGPTTGGSEDGMDEAERAWLQGMYRKEAQNGQLSEKHAECFWPSLSQSSSSHSKQKKRAQRRKNDMPVRWGETPYSETLPTRRRSLNHTVSRTNAERHTFRAGWLGS